MSYAVYSRDEGPPRKSHYDTYPPPPSHQHHPHLAQQARTVPNSPALSTSASGSLLHTSQSAHHLGPRSYTSYSLGPASFVDEQLVSAPGGPIASHDGASSHLGAPLQGIVSPLVDGSYSHNQHSQPPSPGGGGGGYYTTFEPQPRGYPSHRPLRHTISDASLGGYPAHRPLTPDALPQPPPPRAVPITYGSSLKVVQWTPQRGDEGTQVTIVLDSAAIQSARPSPYSNMPASFGAGSPQLDSNGAPHPGVNRRFAVIFGQAQAPTKFTRAQAIDGNGVGQSMSAGPNEEDAFVVLTTFVPSRQAMGPPGERVMILVQSIDVDTGAVVESCIVGEWDPQQAISAYGQRAPATPRISQLKRSGEDLSSGREAPGLRSPAGSVHDSPVRGQGEWHHTSATHTPNIPQHSQMASLDTYDASASARPVPLPAPAPAPPPAASTSATLPPPPPPLPRASGSRLYPPQPELIRTSQIHAAKNGYGATYSHKVVLKLQGDLNTMAMGWTNEEWTARRRLVQFWPQQDGNIINVNFRPIPQNEYVQNSIVISCIFRDDFNECFVTSVDTIYLLEALVGSRFTVEEKNRIRRNLEGFKPQTVSKAKPDAEPFFKLIMGFPNPKPRNIEKDVKVFPWKILAQALKKIMSKYSANYPLNPDGTPVGGLAPAQTVEGSAAGESPQVDGASPNDEHASPHGNAPAGPSSSTTSPNLSHGTSPHLQQPPYAQQQYVEAAPSGGTHSPPQPQSTSASSSQVFASYSTPQTAYPTPLPVGNGSPAASATYAAYQPDSAGASAATGLFPSAEDYGVSASHFQQQHQVDGLQQPHLRSYSEGGQYGASQQDQQPPPTYSGATNGTHGDDAAQQQQYAKEQQQQQNGHDEHDQPNDTDAA
ncbi:transcriptional regulator Medusa [Rhodotorula toruloides]|uniref:Transcriptional regulator Medusa n=1 Tax=Rhodotorula toruloides TaxID=5286 RepID=A0A511KQ76_RHOTO|nr:transcriptional regulator Medusa [Rhodotorula toruloides]